MISALKCPGFQRMRITNIRPNREPGYFCYSFTVFQVENYFSYWLM